MFVRIVILGLALLPIWASRDAFAGAWKLNVAKSTTSSWAVVRARNQLFQVVAGGYRVSTGRASTSIYCDGRDRPDAASSVALLVGADTAAAQCVDGQIIKTVFKRAGKAVATMTRKVSANRTHMTVTIDGVTAQNEKLHSVLLYERQ